ncbi:gamma-glutamyltranspeptidase [Kluyvera georgiana ATCC 51603]|uniref:Gamma-glutamyltranspeptidase n=1 Tax=Kluyvera georgiana ATCC 51603 TaxID=1354264 RepID=A0A1B7JSQ6_9ENTR|nr:gamma-glutamyltranspeptidase [Kluyvera georgiana ATCC 51603]
MTQIQSAKCMQGMAVAPHSLAAESAVAVLRDGGNAVEAMVAAAATVAVVYPHMNGIGGDGFWLISRPGEEPVAIQACGFAAEKANIDFYRQAGYTQVPVRGPLAANTVAGTVGGWERALEWAGEHTDNAALPLTRLLHDAIHYARHGVPVTSGLHQQITARLPQLGQYPGFCGLFAPEGQALTPDDLLL